MKWIALALTFAMPFLAFAQEQQPAKAATAQEQQVPKQVIKEFASDLAKLQQAVLEARRMQQVETAAHGTESLKFTKLRVTNSSTMIRAGADDAAPLIESPAVGVTYRVLDKVRDWYAVQLPASIKGYEAGWVKASDVVPFGFRKVSFAKAGGSVMDAVFEGLVEHARKVKKKWQSNPYVSVSGFSLGLVPPNLSVNFEFKK